MWFVLRLLTLVGVYVWKFFWRRLRIDRTEHYRGTVAAK